MIDHTMKKQNRHHEQGSNLVEMALVIFVLVFLLIGIADFGRAFNNYIIIINASREGARFASHFPQTEAEDDVKAAVVQEAANNGLDLSDTTIAEILITPEIADRDSGSPITVTVNYTFTTFIAAMVGLDEIPLHAKTGMIIFGQDE